MTDDLRSQYILLRDGPALIERPQRGLLEISGKDRAPWLHNLVTNQVKPLSLGDGVYAFALNVQGRILFDLNLLVHKEVIWLDIDRPFLPAALKHFQKYHIVEDIQIADRSADFARFALAGERAKNVAGELGAPQAAKMPALGVTRLRWGGAEIALVRHDFAGPFSVELYVAMPAAGDARRELQRLAGVVREPAVQVHRIEAGVPWPGAEIAEEYLPAETGQLGRAVSFNKGCYLGQEIVERMRSRGALARKLTGLALQGDAVPPAGAHITDAGGKAVGTITSSCWSFALERPIALAYLKAAAARAGAGLGVAWDGGSADAIVQNLPFVGTSE